MAAARSLSIKPLVTALFYLAAVSASLAGFEEGIEAWDQGDYGKARKEFAAAAQKGHAVAQFNLGLMYFEGLGGLDRDVVLAAGWTRKSADQDYAPAQFSLAQMYLAGLGVPRDFTTAAHYMRQAALRGHGQAMHNLANLYAQAKGVPLDHVAAYVWYSRALAVLDDADSEITRKNRAAIADVLNEDDRRQAEKLLNQPME